MSLPAATSDSIILITGASAGIGTELARQLAGRGHNLALVARRRIRLDELAEELRAQHGVEVHVLPCDLGDDAARAQLITDVVALGKQVVGVCNNAGFGTFGRYADLDKERERAMVRLNVLALHELTGAFISEMVARRAGAILNVASIAAFQPIPGNATYAATKSFVQSFSEAVHAELHGTGVSCTTLCPGPVPTEFGEIAGASAAEAKVPSFVSVEPTEVAAAAVRGMERGKRSVVPGMATKGIALSGRFAPRSVLLPATRMVTGSSLFDRS